MYRQVKNRLVHGQPYRSEVYVHPEDMAIGNELRGDIRSAHDIPVKVLTDPDRERGVPVQVIYLTGGWFGKPKALARVMLPTRMILEALAEVPE